MPQLDQTLLDGGPPSCFYLEAGKTIGVNPKLVKGGGGSCDPWLTFFNKVLLKKNTGYLGWTCDFLRSRWLGLRGNHEVGFGLVLCNAGVATRLWPMILSFPSKPGRVGRTLTQRNGLFTLVWFFSQEQETANFSGKCEHICKLSHKYHWLCVWDFSAEKLEINKVHIFSLREKYLQV